VLSEPAHSHGDSGVTAHATAGGPAILRANQSGYVVYANPAAHALLNIAGGEVMVPRVIPSVTATEIYAAIQDGSTHTHTENLAGGAARVTVQGMPDAREACIVVETQAEAETTETFAERLERILLAVDSGAYFYALTRELALCLGVQHAIAAEFTGYPIKTLRVIGHWNGEDWTDDGEFTPEGTPFENILKMRGRPYWVEDQINEEHDDKAILNDFPIRGLAGTALEDGLENVIGVVAVADYGPIPETPASRAVLSLFGACAARQLLHNRDEKEARYLLVDLRQRMRELSCIYGLTESIRTRSRLSEICEDLLALIPEAWQYPEIARARVSVDGEDYTSEGFTQTGVGMSAAIVANGRARGSVQVFYLEDDLTISENGPFLPSERNLIDALARMMGDTIEKLEAESANREQSATLARERNQLEAILRNIGDGVVVTDSDDSVLLLNNTAQLLLGITDTRFDDKSLLDYVDDDAFKKRWRETKAAGRNITKEDVHIEQPVRRALSATRTRIPDLRHDQDGYVTIFHDVTKEREVEQMKNDFVSSVTHELRTPMTSIKGFASTLARNPQIDDEKRQRFLSIIGEESERLLRLIEELLLIARLESGHIELDQESVDLTRVVEEALNALEPQIVKKGLEVSKDVDPDTPSIRGDHAKLHILVSNLVGNAVKFTPHDGRITVRLYPDEGDAIFEVKDSGIGIPHTDHRRIFDRFYRVHRAGETHPGTGLGLFIVREIVNLHSGSVALSSRVHQGSTFTVRLPVEGPGSQEDSGRND